jgi:hypothetical protein
MATELRKGQNGPTGVSAMDNLVDDDDARVTTLHSKLQRRKRRRARGDALYPEKEQQ